MIYSVKSILSPQKPPKLSLRLQK